MIGRWEVRKSRVACVAGGEIVSLQQTGFAARMTRLNPPRCPLLHDDSEEILSPARHESISAYTIWNRYVWSRHISRALQTPSASPIDANHATGNRLNSARRRGSDRRGIYGVAADPVGGGPPEDFRAPIAKRIHLDATLRDFVLEVTHGCI